MSAERSFSPEQMNYLQGLAMGADVARLVRGLPVLSGNTSPAATVRLGPGQRAAAEPSSAAAGSAERLHWEAQQRTLAAGGQLNAEEQLKREKDPFSIWDDMITHAREGNYPRGGDVFRYKFHGLFYVAPAQDAFMCRLRIPGGALAGYQVRGLADLAERYAGGYVDVTTRANLQLREIRAEHCTALLQDLSEIGIVPRGSGADNVRNVTCTPTSGFDPDEWIETLPLAKQMHHYILQHRELYGLPRKFNIAFEGGGRIASLQDTNDIGFRAVRVEGQGEVDECPAGLYFELTLGGITGHLDFARPTSVVVRPEDCVLLAAAVLRVFIAHGDRTDRRKARFKYLLDRWGLERTLQEIEKEYGRPLQRAAVARMQWPSQEDRWAHVGFRPQKQPDCFYVGVVLPVGRITANQLRRLAYIAETYGSGTLRLTVWQNVLVPDLPEDQLDQVREELRLCGLEWEATSVRSGLVACTGNAGCKYAGADTKRHALELARYLEERIVLDVPINLHLTGCHHSCAQHYIGDIGLEATKVESADGEELVEGYHLCVGGGWGSQQGIGRRIAASVPFEDIPPRVLRLLQRYLELRRTPEESFAEFTRRHTPEQLSEYASRDLVIVP